MSTCIFCGGGTSDEHIFAQWLIRDFGLDKEAIRLGFGADQEGKFELLTEIQKIRKFLLTSVCPTCNNGWMSQLENKAKCSLTPVLGADWPSLDTEFLTALQTARRDVTLWMLKTAATFGAKMSIRVPDWLTQGLPTGQIPPAVVLDLACSEFSAFYVTTSNQWMVMNENGEVAMRQHPDSFRLTWQVRHLILRVSYFPFTERLHRKPRYPVSLYPIFRIPPEYDEQLPSTLWVRRKRYVYADVKQFEDETTYRIVQVLDPLAALRFTRQ